MAAREELQEMLSTVEKEKAELNRLEGQEETYLNRLEKEFNLATPEIAKDRLQKLRDSLASLNEKLELGIVEIKRKYDFGGI